METGLHWGLTYRTGEPSINDSHLHSIMKNRYKHHPYQYAPQVLEKALMLNLILYIPISEEQFTLIEEKKRPWFPLWLLQKKFYSEKLTKKPKKLIITKSVTFYSFWSFQTHGTNLTWLSVYFHFVCNFFFI